MLVIFTTKGIRDGTTSSGASGFTLGARRTRGIRNNFRNNIKCGTVLFFDGTVLIVLTAVGVGDGTTSGGASGFTLGAGRSSRVRFDGHRNDFGNYIKFRAEFFFGSTVLIVFAAVSIGDGATSGGASSFSRGARGSSSIRYNFGNNVKGRTIFFFGGTVLVILTTVSIGKGATSSGTLGLSLGTITLSSI